MQPISSFESFLEERERAARAFVSGNAKPVLELTSEHDPSSFFAPDGQVRRGAREVLDAHRSGARSFGASGDSRFEIIQSAQSGDLAFWTGFQHATVHLHQREQPVSMKLRITEIFRREHDGWKLIHRHADPGEAMSSN